MSSKRVVAFIVFSLVITRIAWVCYDKPSYNWDTLAYMAIVLDVEEDDPDAIHQTTYRVAQQEIPPDKYGWMIDTTHAVKKDVLIHRDKFFQYTSFFRVKPLYTGLSYLAYKLGVPLSKAPVVPSVISFVAISFLLIGLFRNFFAEWISCLLSLCIMVSPPVLEAARLATPDALSTLVILLTFRLILNSSHWIWLIFVLSLSVFVRVDNFILAVIVLCFQFFKPGENIENRLPPFVFWCSIILWTGLSYGLMMWANVDGGFENFYGGLSRKVNPLVVLKDALVGLNTLQTSHLSIVIAVSAIVLFYKKHFTFKSRDIQQYLFLMMMTYLAVRYVLFPDLTTRFYLPIYIMAVVLALQSISTLISTNRLQKNDW